MKVYLCDEQGERFYIDATSPADAAVGAAMYGAKVLAGPLAKRYEKINPYTLKIVNGKVVK
jgi:hypothetical protein